MSEWFGGGAGYFCPVPAFGFCYPAVVPGVVPNVAGIDFSLGVVTPSDTGISTPLSAAVGGRVQRAGDTMTGRLELGAGNPVSSLEAACKQYVDAMALAASLGVPPPGALSLANTLSLTVTTAGVGQGLSNPNAFGIFRPTLNLSGSNDQLLNYNVVEATLNITGALNSVGGVQTNNLNVASYLGNSLPALVGSTPPAQYSANTNSVNKGPGGLMSLYLAGQGVTLPTDGIFAYSAGNVGAQSWALYMATTLLNNTATNPFEGPTLQWEFDVWASGVDTTNGRFLGGQINGHQKYGQGQWTYNVSVAQTAPGTQLQFAAGGVPQASLGLAVIGAGIAAGTVVVSANNVTGLVTLSAATTSAAVLGAPITFGGSWPTTFAYGIYWELDAACRVGSFMLTNQYICAGIDLRGSFIPQGTVLANAAVGATTLHVSDITCFVYANYFGDGQHTYAPPSTSNPLRSILQDSNGTRQTVSVVGYTLDGPGLDTGVVTLATGLVTAITDATTTNVTLTPNSAAVWLKDGQNINFDFGAQFQIGVDTTNAWLAINGATYFSGAATFNMGIYIAPNLGAGRLYLNKNTVGNTANFIRYNPYSVSFEFAQNYLGADTVLFGAYDLGASGGVAYFNYGVKMANLPVSPAGLAAGSLYRSSSAANATVMIV